MKKKLLTGLAIGLLSSGIAGNASATSYADIAFVVDQTGSMGDEFGWIASSIGAIANAVSAAGITANYGIAGYERYAGTESTSNVWSDLGSDITPVINAANYAAGHLYGSTERGYHAADWAADNFTWTGGNYAKVLVLITDENADQGSGITESALGTDMTAHDVLLNVITYSNMFYQWDDAVYSTPTPYLGLFDLTYLHNDPSGFTTAFTAAKLQEIQQHEVPEPATMLLMGTGLAGLVGARRKRKA